MKFFVNDAHTKQPQARRFVRIRMCSIVKPWHFSSINAIWQFGLNELWAKSTPNQLFAHTSLFSAGIWAYVLWAKSTPKLFFAHTQRSTSMGEIDHNMCFRPYFSFQRRIPGSCFMGEINPAPAFRPYSALRQYGRNRPQHVFSPITLVPVPGPRLMLYGRNQLPTIFPP